MSTNRPIRELTKHHLIYTEGKFWNGTFKSSTKDPSIILISVRSVGIVFDETQLLFKLFPPRYLSIVYHQFLIKFFVTS